MDKVKVEFNADGSGFFRETEKIKAGVANLRSELLGNLKGAIFATFSIEALKKFGEEFKSFVSDIAVASKQTGANTAELQVWEKQIKRVGGSMEDVTRIINKLSAARDKAMEDPGGKEAKAFSKLGIDQGTLVNSDAPELFRRLQEQISKSGSAAGSMGNLLDLLGEKSVKFLSVFSESFAATEEKLRKAGKLIDSEVIEKFKKLEEINKGLTLGDAVLGGAKNKATVVSSIEEAYVRTKSALQTLMQSATVPILGATDLLGAATGGRLGTQGAAQAKAQAIRSDTEAQQTEFALYEVGGLSPAQTAEITNRMKGMQQERENQLKRIAELQEKLGQKELSDQEKLAKMKADQLKSMQEMDRLAKSSDKTGYRAELEKYLQNALKVKELDDKVAKSDAEQIKKDDKLVDEYLKKLREKVFASYRMDDGLVTTGNFLGTSRARLEYVNLQVEQRDLLKQIEMNTRLFLEKNQNVQSADDFPALL